ncbi:lipocalin family protein [Algibacter sp. R77976]|uniref:lipocalin family protein n=1 Tax=Algibacter sp. R77976 TaxID=3093873 RepID=UPI0037C4F7FF
MTLKPVIIALLFLFMFFVKGYSQTNNFKNSDRYYLVGTWLVESINYNENIVFKRKIGNQKDNTRFQIEISNNGIVNLKQRGITRKCPSDNSVKTKTKGTWSLNKENRIINATIPIIRGIQEFKIVDLNINRMVLTRVKSE